MGTRIEGHINDAFLIQRFYFSSCLSKPLKHRVPSFSRLDTDCGLGELIRCWQRRAADADDADELRATIARRVLRHFSR